MSYPELSFDYAYFNVEGGEKSLRRIDHVDCNRKDGPSLLIPVIHDSEELVYTLHGVIIVQKQEALSYLESVEVNPCSASGGYVCTAHYSTGESREVTYDEAQELIKMLGEF